MDEQVNARKTRKSGAEDLSPRNDKTSSGKRSSTADGADYFPNQPARTPQRKSSLKSVSAKSPDSKQARESQRRKSPTFWPSYSKVTKFGPNPKFVVCPKCRQNVMTSIKVQPSMQTHLIAIVLLLFLCWPFVCVPYCVDSCQNTNHYCPNCNELIGTYNAA